jgi:hypothetical protein
MTRKAARKAGKPRTRKSRTLKAAAPRGKTPASPATPSDAIDALVAASAQALRLPLDPAWHGGVKFNLQLILRMAALFDDFALPDDTEPAPVFHA